MDDPPGLPQPMQRRCSSSSTAATGISPARPASSARRSSSIWTPPPSAVWQCKNRQQLSLGAWLDETVEQQHNAKRFLHWLIVKRKGTTYPGDQFAICTLSQARTITTLLNAP